NCTAPRIGLVLIQAQLTDTCQRLRRESLVEFHCIDFVEVPAGATENLPRCQHWTHAHDFWLQATCRIRYHAGTGFEPQLFDAFLRGHNDSGGAIVERGGIAGGGDIAKLGHRTQFGQDLWGRTWAWAFIRINDGDITLAVFDLHGHDFSIEFSICNSCECALM